MNFRPTLNPSTRYGITHSTIYRRHGGDHPSQAPPSIERRIHHVHLRGGGCFKPMRRGSVTKRLHPPPDALRVPERRSGALSFLSDTRLSWHLVRHGPRSSSIEARVDQSGLELRGHRSARGLSASSWCSQRSTPARSSSCLLTPTRCTPRVPMRLRSCFASSWPLRRDACSAL